MRQGLAPFIALAILLLTLPAAASPRIDTTQRNLDFGRIFQGEKVHHTFEFANAGDAPLKVSKVHTSCGCTAALVSSRVIAPGEKGEISVTFDSTRFRGNIKKTVSLHTDDPQQAVTTFTLRGVIDQEIAYRPQRLILGPIGADRTASAEITLINRGNKKITLNVARLSLAEMTARLETTALPPSGSARLRVEVTAKKGQRRLNGWVILETDSLSTPQIRIPVLVSVE